MLYVVCCLELVALVYQKHQIHYQLLSSTVALFLFASVTFDFQILYHVAYHIASPVWVFFLAVFMLY